MTHTQILFPHLHIAFQNVGQKLTIGNFSIAYYGIIIAIGMVLGGALVLRISYRCGYNENDILDVLICGLICGVIGARLYYVIFSWDFYKDDLISVFNLRQGGLGIYGGIIGGVIGGIAMMKHKNIPISVGGDLCVLGFPVGQCIGRWGNFCNREAFGGYTDGLFAMWLPVDAVRSNDDITAEMLSHIQMVDGVEYISVHPTFLYESFWNFMIFLVLLLIFQHKKFDGQIFAMYFLLYGIGRALIEPLRTDQLLLWNTNIPVSVVVSVMMIIASCGILIYGFTHPKLAKTPIYEHPNLYVTYKLKFAARKNKN